jgi:uncharacterized RDD family membrane protein YckC
LAEGWTYRLKYGKRNLDLAEGKLTVGRSRHCDLSIQELTISRKHVFLTIGAGQILVQDLGSSNGTYVNGRRMVGESVLRDGDTLRLGHASLEVEIRASSGERAAGPERLTAARDVATLAPPLAEPPGHRTPRPPPPSGAGELPEDDDAEPTKRVPSPGIDWKALRVRPAGLWERLLAVLLDGVWIGALAALGYRFGRPSAFLLPALALPAIWLGWAYLGTTPGKRVLGLYVRSEEADGRGLGLVVAAIRLGAAILSLALFGLGFLIVAFSPTRQALHDRLAGTRVVRVDRAP